VPGDMSAASLALLLMTLKWTELTDGITF